MSLKHLLLLEINEVPWSVYDAYVDDGRFLNIKKLLKSSHRLTTVCSDTGHLSPWVTWPTIHRGVPDYIHKIKDLGQDASTFQGVPIWDEYLKLNLSVGIFGSMQSWPPKFPGKSGFYVPDTFSHDNQCFPKSLEPIQQFNLNQVKKNHRVIDNRIKETFKSAGILYSLIKNGLSIKSIFLLVHQLIMERLDSRYKSRRPIFQTVIFFDLFKHLVAKNGLPYFTTFFTNHVAGVMHRYWANIFIEDSSKLNKDDFYKKHVMDFAMKLTDEIVGYSLKLQSSSPDIVLVVASSMGQALSLQPNHDGIEAHYDDPSKLFEILGIMKSSYKDLMAMAPQKAFEFDSDDQSASIEKRVSEIKTTSGNSIFGISRHGKSLSLTLANPPIEDRKQEILIDGQNYTWEQIGVEFINVEPSSGYHIPEGSLAILGVKEIPNEGDRIQTASVKDLLVKLGLG